MTEEELQAKIALVRESMECLDDIETVRVSAKFMRAVLDTLDAMQAKLDAVPVEALAFCVDAADYTYDVMWAEAKAWIDAQVQP